MLLYNHFHDATVDRHTFSSSFSVAHSFPPVSALSYAGLPGAPFLVGLLAGPLLFSSVGESDDMLPLLMRRSRLLNLTLRFMPLIFGWEGFALSNLIFRTVRKVWN